MENFRLNEILFVILFFTTWTFAIIFLVKKTYDEGIPNLSWIGIRLCLSSCIISVLTIIEIFVWIFGTIGSELRLTVIFAFCIGINLLSIGTMIGHKD